VRLITLKLLPSCIDAPLPMLFPLLETALVCLFWDLELSEIIVLSKWISVWEIRKSQLEPGQMSRVAEEVQLCSCWPKSYKSVAIHELVHCHDGGTMCCFFTAEVFFP
jgi:hypothetical protein